MMLVHNQDNQVLDHGKPLYVVSDLHLGDGSSSFARQGKDTLFLHFLDHIEREGGQLILLGDLLELWRFSLDAVIEQWHGLLDRLLQLQAVYIPGNHDAQVADPQTAHSHPLFSRVMAPFTMTLGDRRLRFMHGHELDPFIEKRLHENPLYMRCFHTLFDLRECIHWFGSESLADLGLGASELLLRCWHWLTRVSDHVMHPELLLQTSRTRLCHLRTQKMLSRYRYHRDEAAYDVAIVGHTHRVGRFAGWYYNSGCWVKPYNSFLKIHPDAFVEVFEWSGYRPRTNQTIIA